jgi:hypothetical protein
MQSNKGIIFSGGTQTIGQAVAGTKARAEQHVTAGAKDPAATSQELAQKLKELICLLQANQASLPEGTSLVGDASRVAAELDKPAPSKTKISSLLQVLEEGTKDIASIASIVSSVKALALGLLGIA